MIRIAVPDRIDDLALGEPVDLGDEIVARLRRHGQLVQPWEVAHDQVAGTAGGAHGNIDQGVHGMTTEGSRGR